MILLMNNHDVKIYTSPRPTMKTTKNLYLENFPIYGSAWFQYVIKHQLVLHNMQFGNFHDQNFSKLFHTKISCTVCTKIFIYETND